MALKSNGLKFTPPKEQKLPRYASYGGGIMKTHVGLGGAKQSLEYRSTFRGEALLPGQSWYERPLLWKEGFILELVDGEWFTLYHVEEGTKDDELPWKQDRWTHKQYSWTYVTEPRYKPEDCRHEKVSRPLSRDEYAAWRVAVELERRGITG